MYPTPKATAHREVIVFGAGLSSASAVRHRVEALLAVWGVRTAFDSIRLLVSELVVNVVRHVDESGWVVVERRGTGVRVEVHDPSGHLLELREPSVEAEDGRGLQIVDALADRWGVEREKDGKYVWFEMHDLDPATPS